MHPALQLDMLDGLRPCIRELAHAACSLTGTVEDIQRLRSAQLNASEDEQLMLLPVFYTNLDPVGVPDVDRYDTENPSYKAASSVRRALLSLYALYAIPFPDEIGPYIWPRVWPWVEFLHTYRDHLSDPTTDDDFSIRFLVFAGNFHGHKETFSTIVSTPGVWFMVARAWSGLTRFPGEDRDQLFYLGLDSFMVDPKCAETANVSELVEGAGGTWDYLADLIMFYIEAIHGLGRRGLEDSHIHFAFAILGFLLHIEPTLSGAAMMPLGPIGAALASRNVVRDLTTLLCDLSESSSPAASCPLRKCFRVLGTLLMANPGDLRWLSEALHSELLRALVVCSLGPKSKGLSEFVTYFLESLIPPRLCYPTILTALDNALKDVENLVSADAFDHSDMNPVWLQFTALAKERIHVLRSYEHNRARCMRACDNLQVSVFILSPPSPCSQKCSSQCNGIHVKSGLRRCSGCHSLYYCSEPCQFNDWTKGGHRRACKAYGYGTLSLRSDNELSPRKRSFLRALIHSDYSKKQSKAIIYLQTVLCMARSPGESYAVLYDYTQGEVEITLELLNGTLLAPRFRGPEGTDIVSRVQRSGGRMGLDVLAFIGARGLQFRVIPVHRNKSSVYRDMQALAAGMLLDRPLHVNVADEIVRFICAETEDAELVEVH